MSGHQEKPELCDSCQFPTDDLEEVDAYARVRGLGPFSPEEDKVWGWLCPLCRNGIAGRIFCYPRNFPSEASYYTELINYGFNTILKEFRMVQKPQQSLTAEQAAFKKYMEKD